MSREQFEKLPEIRKIMNENGIYFMNHSGWYEARDFKDFEYEQYINGAWYAFQEQENKIKALEKELEMRKQGASVMSWHRDQIIEIVNSYHSGSDTDDMRDEILEILK